jgi:hypothetical protein
MTILGPNTRTSIACSAVSGTRNKANRGNRKVTYHAFRAFRALFFGNALWQRDKKFGLASPLGHT